MTFLPTNMLCALSRGCHKLQDVAFAYLPVSVRQIFCQVEKLQADLFCYQPLRISYFNGSSDVVIRWGEEL